MKKTAALKKNYCFESRSDIVFYYTQVDRHLSFVVADGGVHLLLVDVLDLGGGAAQDALLLLFGQRLGYHLDGLGPLVPAGHKERFCSLPGV